MTTQVPSATVASVWRRRGSTSSDQGLRTSESRSMAQLFRIIGRQAGTGPPLPPVNGTQIKPSPAESDHFTLSMVTVVASLQSELRHRRGSSVRATTRSRRFEKRSGRSPLVLSGLLLAALLVSACGGQPGATPIAAGASARPVPVAAEAVYRGDIEQTQAYSGEIRAKEQVSVVSTGTGRIERLLVDVGSRVKAGDVLADLDQNLPRIQMLQARAALAQATIKLADIDVGARAEDVAVAAAALNQQQVKLASMLAQGRAEDVEQAQTGLQAQQAKLDLMLQGGRPETVAQAQAALDAAEAKLRQVEQGATEDVRQAALSAVDSDVAAQASAEASYAAVGGSNAADLQAALSLVDSEQAQLAAARSTVAAADAALVNLKGSAAADLQVAQTAYDVAQAQLKTAQAALDENAHPTQANIAQALAVVEAANAQRQAAEANQTALEQNAAPPCQGAPGQPRNGTACAAAKAAADAGVLASERQVEAAQGQLDLLRRGGPPAARVQLEAAVVEAQSTAQAARLRLESIQTAGLESERAQLQAQRDMAQSQAASAQEGLNVAQTKLAAIQNGTLDAQVKAAAAQVTAAREKLKSDRARLDQVAAGPTDDELQQVQAGVDQTTQQLALAHAPHTDQDLLVQRAAVEQARSALRKASAPYTAYDLQQQEEAVAQTEALYQKALNPYTGRDLQVAQAMVDQAQAQLELAELGLAETQVIAPVDGVIAERHVAPGALVNPTTPIVTLVPPALELVVSIDEGQLGQVREGQSVTLAVPAYPEQAFSGTVKAIAPTLDTKNRTASVRIEPRDEDGRLRPGMFAHLSITTAVHQDVLLLPVEAVQRTRAQSTVVVIGQDNRIQNVPIRIGLTNATLVEIVSGLDEGQLVATGATTTFTNGDIVAPQVERLSASEMTH